MPVGWIKTFDGRLVDYHKVIRRIRRSLMSYVYGQCTCTVSKDHKTDFMRCSVMAKYRTPDVTGSGHTTLVCGVHAKAIDRALFQMQIGMKCTQLFTNEFTPIKIKNKFDKP